MAISTGPVNDAVGATIPATPPRTTHIQNTDMIVMTRVVGSVSRETFVTYSMMIVADTYRLARYPKWMYASGPRICGNDPNTRARSRPQIAKPFGTYTCWRRNRCAAIGTA